MGMFGKLMRGGIAAKGARILKREASKPQNQRKAKELFSKFTGGGSKGGKAPQKGRGKPRR